MDEQKEGGVLRSLFFLGLCLVLVYLGFKAITADHALFGLALWAIGPMIWGVSESMRNRAIAEKVVNEEFPDEAYQPFTQTQDQPHKSLIVSDIEALRDCFLTADFQAPASSIKDDESLSDWCRRISNTFPSSAGIDANDVYGLLISAVQFNKPRPKMPVADWFDATQRRIKEIMTNMATIDLGGPNSGRQKGETNAAWLSRVGPLFLNVQDGQSKDDAIETLVEIAAKAPPQDGESMRAWIERVQPYIEEHNASLS